MPINQLFYVENQSATALHMEEKKALSMQSGHIIPLRIQPSSSVLTLPNMEIMQN